jgi:hypothetical protein
MSQTKDLVSIRHIFLVPGLVAAGAFVLFYLHTVTRVYRKGTIVDTPIGYLGDWLVDQFHFHPKRCTLLCGVLFSLLFVQGYLEERAHI